MEPDVLIVDEILAMGDEGFRARVRGRLRREADDGRIVLIRNFRIAIDQRILELPAGTLEPGARPKREERNLYGPRPKIYGPVISRPKPTTTTARPAYGPKVVRSDRPTDNAPTRE